MVSLADVKKLKVPELKAELEKRGLDTTGLKQALVERLEEAVTADVDNTGGDQEETDPAGPSGTKATTKEQPSTKHKPIAFPAKAPAGAPAADKPAAAAVEAKPATDAPPAATVAHAIKSAAQTEAERQKARAERFGIQVKVPEVQKKEIRAQRFGLKEEGGEKKKSAIGGLGLVDPLEEIARRKERAARFNLPVPSSKDEEAAKKQQRAERFGGKPGGKPAAKSNEEEQKRKAREARFKANAPSQAAATNGDAEKTFGTANQAEKGEQQKKLEERAKRFATADADAEAKKKARAERFAVEAK
ncbi:hypothetical protein WJX72_007935 [[Myrmecia] bisecta]|uniref:SAP domain-containing protein n=1 Tax=[Myrmecia] bisecta TaxID=41462 RepID=A0AAW1Q431_9CHLO